MASTGSNKVNRIIASGLISLIQCYRFAISLLLGHCCRFQPSCSTYAIDAIHYYGCCKGSFMAIKRLLRCHPWHPGGVDPAVPAGDHTICNLTGMK